MEPPVPFARQAALVALVVPLLLAPRRAPAQVAALVPEAASPLRRVPKDRDLAAGRVRGRLVVDGRLDEAAWGEARVADGFTQVRPSPGAAPSAATTARVLVDDDALWVGVRLEERDPAGPLAVLGRRDAELPGDWVHVLVDSYFDRRTAFRFSVNAAGVVQDALVANDVEFDEDRGWNAVWEVTVGREDGAWTAEFRIPLTQLRFNGAADSARTLGLQVLRDRARGNERSAWAPLLPDAAGFVSRFGTLSGVRLARVPRRFELVPYAVARHDHVPVPAGDPMQAANAARASLGADLQLGLTPELTLTATLRPDFGQVEADPSEVNLSGVETFFAEQRPFFMEGADIFRVQAQSGWWWFGRSELFYSRRIGRRPQASTPDAAEWEEVPGATRVLGAAKLSGRTAGGWSLGLLDAVTAEERATWAGSDRLVRQAVVEPRTNYAMLRARRQTASGWSALGATLTATHRDLTAETADELRASAWTGSLDARHRWDAAHELAVTLAASRVVGSAEAIARTQRSTVHLFQRPDAARLGYDTTRTSLGGLSLDARAQRLAGAWRWGVVGNVTTPGHETNDLGFLASADQGSVGGWVGRFGLQPTRWAQRWELWTNVWSQWTLGGERKMTGVSQYGFLQRASGWVVDGQARVMLPALSVTALRGGPALAQPGRRELFASISTDPRRRVALTLAGNGGSSIGLDEWSWSLRPALTVRPSSAAELSLQPSYGVQTSAAQYVTDVADAGGRTRWVVGGLRQRTLAMGVRASYTLSPTLTVQTWMQPFASAGEYGTLREVRRARAAGFADRFDTFDAGRASRAANGDWAIDRDADGASDYTVEDPDFHVRELRANTVVRWEFRPGSTLFLVWTQERDADDAAAPFGPVRDTRALFGTRPRNTVLAKVSWYLRR